MTISLKETNETDYWISILKDTGYIEEKLFKSLSDDYNEIIKLLIEKGADINLIYNNGRENITALDSAIKELGKERVKEKETIRQEIEELINFLKSKGAKRYNDFVAR